MKKKLSYDIYLVTSLFFLLMSIVSCGKPVVSEQQEENDPFNYVFGSLKERETLAQALQSKGLGYSKFQPVLTELNRIYNLKRLIPEDSFHVKVDTLGTIHQLNYHPIRDKIKIYTVLKDSLGGYFPFVDSLKVDKILKKTEGEIRGSLWASLREFGESGYLIGQFTEIFQWDVDFLVDPREGDKFCLVYEQYNLNGEFVKYGDILVAEYNSRNYGKRAYRFVVDDAHAKYFDENGESFQKAFLKSPLNYTRISSYFSKGRYHPVLKIVRPHNGVDYAAPKGTPVVAAADGVVSHAAWKGGHPAVGGRTGGYGKTVMIRHPNGYETLYGHLNDYAGGIKKGVRVSQNQIIGFVGSTGLSTGPHLHYTVYHHGTAIDPLKMKNVAGPPVPKNQLDKFKNTVKRANHLIDEQNEEVSISIPLAKK